MSKSEEVTILLVDDDESHAELAKINLERSGLLNKIHYFTNGQKALDFLAREKPTALYENKYLMILDINMPGLDGHQVLESVKSDEHMRHIPVIMLTTAEDEREVERCYEMGCNIYMTKPMEYENFSEAIHELGLFIQKARFPGAAARLIM